MKQIILLLLIPFISKSQNIYTNDKLWRIADIETKVYGFDSATCLKLDVAYSSDNTIVLFSWYLMNCQNSNNTLATGSLRLPFDPSTNKETEELYLFNLMAHNFLSVKFK